MDKTSGLYMYNSSTLIMLSTQRMCDCVADIVPNALDQLLSASHRTLLPVPSDAAGTTSGQTEVTSRRP